jgi:hypothetical protein
MVRSVGNHLGAFSALTQHNHTNVCLAGSRLDG